MLFHQERAEFDGRASNLSSLQKVSHTVQVHLHESEKDLNEAREDFYKRAGDLYSLRLDLYNRAGHLYRPRKENLCRTGGKFVRGGRLYRCMIRNLLRGTRSNRC